MTFRRFDVSTFPSLFALGVLVCPILSGCRSPGPAHAADSIVEVNTRHAGLYGDVELPRKIGSVESVGLMIPAVSPDGRRLLYLRTDQEYLSTMTLLGSAKPGHTPPSGTLSIWIRPLEGNSPGRRLSPQRWAHSPVWSPSGGAVAYVVNGEWRMANSELGRTINRDATENRDATNGGPARGSFIVHLDLNTGEESLLGVPGAINCLPRFDTDRLGSRSHMGGTLLFCAGETAAGPFRVYRQRVGEPEPVSLTPLGSDCLFPVVSDAPGAVASAPSGGRAVLCAQAAGEHLAWVTASTLRNSSFVIRNSATWGLSARPALLQTWAGIASPLSPDGQAVLFYDAAQDRVCVLSVAGRIVQRHRPRTIAACWLDPQSIALATPDGVFLVNRTTGFSIPLFNGQWIPCRFVPTTRRLIMLGHVAAAPRGGRQASRRFEIWEVVFKGTTYQE